MFEDEFSRRSQRTGERRHRERPYFGASRRIRRTPQLPTWFVEREEKSSEEKSSDPHSRQRRSVFEMKGAQGKSCEN